MPTKLPRLNITFTDPELYAMIQRDATLNERSESNQIVRNLKKFYEMRKREAASEAELFTPPRLREAKKDDVQVFEMPPPQPERASKIRASLDREKS